MHAVAGIGELDQHGLVVLPEIPVPDDVLVADPRPPTGGRRCGANGCTMTIGIGYGGQPARATGRCPRCGTPYSFLPQLAKGDLVADHYKVLGCLAHGGLGWIYLAEDTRADGHRVVLKGQINVHDALARRTAVEERRSLTDLHHPDIVRIITYAEHRTPAARPPATWSWTTSAGARSSSCSTPTTSSGSSTAVPGSTTSSPTAARSSAPWSTCTNGACSTAT